MTTTKIVDYRAMLNNGDPANMPDIARQMKQGTMASVIKVTFASMTSAAAQDITTATNKGKITALAGITLDANENLPPIGQVLTCRVTAGSAATGPRVMTDSGGTPAAGATGLGDASGGVATISDDGKTLTFEAAITGMVLTYIPRSAKVMTDVWPTVP